MDLAYVHFFADAYSALLVALLFFMPFLGFAFRLGWLFSDWIVRNMKDFLNDFTDIIAILLIKGVRGAKRLWHKSE